MAPGWVKRSYYVIAILVGLLIAFSSLDYIDPDFSIGFLSDKEGIFESHYKYFLYAHMMAAPMVLLLGVFQLWFTASSIHRHVGRLYVILIVFFAAPSGLGMSFYAIGGIWSIVSFSILSVLWLFYTVRSYLFIRKGNIAKHKQFMTRSFILTNSAVLLRIFSYINNHYEIVDLVTGYTIISWLSWLPWLIIYEVRVRWTLR